MKSLVGDIIAHIGPQLGIRVNLEPRYRRVGQLITPDGRRFYFRNTHFDLNGQGAAEIAKDKDYASFFMRQMGYPTPEGRTFFSVEWCRAIGSDQGIDAAYVYAKSLGFPVIVKPNSKSQGVGVAKVHSKQEFYRAVRAVFRQVNDDVVLVQRVVAGDDYRVVVLDDQIVSAYQRIPLSVTGDGMSTVAALFAKKQAEFQAGGRGTSLDPNDYRIASQLRRMKMTWESIPAEAETILLLNNANLSSGGSAVDVTDVLHVDWRTLAIQLSQDMGLRYSGIDVITTDPIDRPPGNYTLIEINAAPGLNHYAEAGERQRLVVEAMYEQILRAFLCQ